MSRPGTLVLLVATIAACASTPDSTPMIVISPGAKERIMVMDRLRHHGAPRRFLPKVTAEEVDEADLPATADDDRVDIEESSTEEASSPGDGGMPQR